MVSGKVEVNLVGMRGGFPQDVELMRNLASIVVS